ncbi:TrkH family potassium uptake protein [Rhodospirillaceae bacterium SYSU D60014]|uniref:TrkH family potassium uptake protein n=1 Tax=Virgifigura deserti TaxID=2268457 RepID=UPI000E66E89F
MPDFRPVLFTAGILLIALSAAMLLPAAVDALRGDPDWQAFVWSAGITGAIGGALMLGYRQPETSLMSAREGFVLTVLAWLALCTASTLPFMLSKLSLSFTDAFFEAMSGLTTTGSTVVVGLDELSSGILLWRAMLHWIGGIGIIVMAVAILPILRVGGMQLFRMESSEKAEKVRPRVTQISSLLASVYVSLTALCAVALVLAGMGPFDAVCHAMSTIATGGFSNYDASIGHFDSRAIEWIIIVFMLIGGTTFVLLARAAQGDARALFRDEQIRWYIIYIGIFITALSLWQILVNDEPIREAVRSSAFNVVSLATTTGFASEDYQLWGSFAVGAVMALLFIGGCTGSTSGGIKVFRFCVLGSVAHRQILHLIHPHRTLPPTYNRKPIADEVVRSVLSFFAFYIGAYAVLSVALTALGLDLVTSLSGAAQALGNVGPGLGPIIGPAGNYVPLPDAAKWLLSFAMLLGRLELLTVVVLFSATFWRG